MIALSPGLFLRLIVRHIGAFFRRSLRLALALLLILTLTIMPARIRHSIRLLRIDSRIVAFRALVRRRVLTGCLFFLPLRFGRHEYLESLLQKMADRLSRCGEEGSFDRIAEWYERADGARSVRSRSLIVPTLQRSSLFTSRLAIQRDSGTAVLFYAIVRTPPIATWTKEPRRSRGRNRSEGLWLLWSPKVARRKGAKVT